ncbi:hypothetical protein BV25DRAFT_1897066 [Artomyces pyxidatus]|uniref:Uncharacterized protein n=1 Tax=Artomyces pyxidatus TaxID=48021 RepID=A0ACB8TGB8_9AGAM|nr:hypothetical protein BV25DRAFT_1897066 [Artomyces pyxidatus]
MGEDWPVKSTASKPGAAQETDGGRTVLVARRSLAKRSPQPSGMTASISDSAAITRPRVGAVAVGYSTEHTVVVVVVASVDNRHNAYCRSSIRALQVRPRSGPSGSIGLNPGQSGACACRPPPSHSCSPPVASQCKVIPSTTEISPSNPTKDE